MSRLTFSLFIVDLLIYIYRLIIDLRFKKDNINMLFNKLTYIEDCK